MSNGSFYSTVTVNFKDGATVNFKSVKTDTIDIDEFNFLKFERLLDVSRWAQVVIDLDDNVRYYEIVPGEM